MISRLKSSSFIKQDDLNVEYFEFEFGDLTYPSQIKFLCNLAKDKTVFEFGTFRGKTTYNLSKYAKYVYTIDIGDIPIINYFPVTVGEFIGDRENVMQYRCDTKTFDYSHLSGKIDLVFVDAGHTYDAVKSDTENAFTMLADDGIIIWDDYSDMFPEVKQYLNELAKEKNLIWIEDLMLMVYRKENK